MTAKERKLVIAALNCYFAEMERAQKYLWANHGTVEELRSIREEIEQTIELREKLIEEDKRAPVHS